MLRGVMVMAVFLHGLLFAPRAWGQDSLLFSEPHDVLRTGLGQTLTTSTQFLQFEASAIDAMIEFSFGFSTDEEIAPGVFFDSLTLTLQDPASSFAVTYATHDRSGVLWAPVAPGGLLIPGDSILREAIPFPDLLPAHSNAVAYTVRAPVPPELLGKPLQFYADLFDNQNAAQSLAWVSVVTPVPEPSTWALLAVALLFIFGFQWRNE